jgi:hypothetical protein
MAYLNPQRFRIGETIFYSTEDGRTIIGRVVSISNDGLHASCEVLGIGQRRNV